VLAFQHAHHLHPDGIVGPRTLAALHKAEHSPSLDHSHQHPLYAQALDGVRALPAGTLNSEHEQRNAAAALAGSAQAGGLRQIDHVVLGTDAARVFAVQGGMDDPAHRRVHVERAHAASQSLDHSLHALQQSASMHSPQMQHVQVPIQSGVEQRGVVMGIRP